MDVIKITGDSIKLGQFLKLIGLVHTGGETKFFLEEKAIFVNKIPENRRGKKLYNGDLIEIEHKKYIIEAKNVVKNPENL